MALGTERLKVSGKGEPVRDEAFSEPKAFSALALI
jgi:hypothetical protein